MDFSLFALVEHEHIEWILLNMICDGYILHGKF